ncbi:STAS domain-containing protein [Alkalihalobacterium bogoriense]|uniref:STAS domain-containing protein n=1 Tax=Alkalihalobacterium bogoriense TaxID=246272 RepID=UPI00047A52F7|nr:STAS domain-containing protein [Alkalihalobacterium bogoriense]
MGEKKQQQHVDIQGVTYRFNVEEGKVQFEGHDVLIFWIESAMKSFVDTIEEVSGDDAANVVMHTAGFRMGEIVGEYFEKQEIEAIMELFPKIYASAGWGAFTVVEFAPEKASLVIRMKNSWEYKINKLQGKTQSGSFLTGHLAGIFTRLFKQNIGCELVKSQLTGAEYDEFHCRPSSVCPIDNIHNYARKQEQKEIEKLEEKVRERTQDLTKLVKDISSPIIPVLDQIVVVPLLGKYDELRSEDMMTQIMENLPRYTASYLILDVTGIDEVVDEYTMNLIRKLTDATSLLGTKSILVGVSPQLGITLTQSAYDLRSIECFSTLKHAIHYALAQEGKIITDK